MPEWHQCALRHQRCRWLGPPNNPWRAGSHLARHSVAPRGWRHAPTTSIVRCRCFLEALPRRVLVQPPNHPTAPLPTSQCSGARECATAYAGRRTGNARPAPASPLVRVGNMRVRPHANAPRYSGGIRRGARTTVRIVSRTRVTPAAPRTSSAIPRGSSPFCRAKRYEHRQVMKGICCRERDHAAM
jgi:hypothetical protein